MKNFFVIGSKTTQSLSPLIFNYWFKLYKIEAKYFFVETKKNNFEKVLSQKIMDKATFGYNVTIPFKNDVFKHIDTMDNHAKKIGAVNCVKIKKKSKGINTDWIGYLNSIKGYKINKSKKVIILGYGGASKAIVYGLYYKGFKNILVFNRSKKLINLGGRKFFTKEYNVIDKFLHDASIIINTTPINPLSKKQAMIVNKNVLVSDIVYRPKNTTFLNNFKKNKKIYGITMLVEQAIQCFYEWFGYKPRIDLKLMKILNNKIK